MNDRQLSKRLQRVAAYVPKGSKTADIGSDHAYLPCYLCLEDQTAKAIAGEVNEGPYLSAVSQVRQSGLTDRISVRMGNGLEVIEHADQVNVITIAGMGGALITSILEDGKDKLKEVDRLILQPNVSAITIREWLDREGWSLASEEIIEEDDKIYEILVADRGENVMLYEEDRKKKMLLGPYLINEMNEAFQKKWTYEMKNWERILTQFERATETPELSAKKDELKHKIKMVQEVLR
ncbi:tRNA (adenine(22)-N(1))-methyltransferase TrmK [Alkalihalophilus marmarensis]|jgi:tRNA (adenine22-N1)-methyltransferase|uniref:tRNA (adenine(22)-N(1))-methyltransferase n=1 Tax=Alkalihalophilus marmarensis TaxID=521377 RepID=UPI00203D3B40|nr:tRNA (adenine(22)-N(1))-methyltransferase TrmK [Alkalihalophilus marmarensis]MCM3488606.1 tRNA (adenine(22)-N(1))-methyltransferase TrmK [Alkalihalophilus marmarensis]